MNLKKSVLIPLLLSAFAFEAQAASLGNIMLLGDSVTHAAGGSDKQGYRYELWQKLVTNGDSFDFVGSENQYFSDAGYTPPAINGIAFDKDHEGHSSYSTKDILGTGPENSTSDNIDSWLNTYTPDTAVILLGFNDIFQNSSAQSATDRLETIIGKIQADNSNVNIFVGTLYEYDFTSWDFTSNPTATEQENQLNAFNAILNGTFANDNGVTVVSMNNTLNPSLPSNLYDGLHPGVVGEQFIADQFYNAISSQSAVSAVPVPAAVWLFGSALVGLAGIGRRKKETL